MANLALTVVAFAAFFAIVSSFATSWLDGTGRVAEGFRVARATDAITGRTSLTEERHCVTTLGSSTSFRIVNSGQSVLRNFASWTLTAKYKSSATTTRVASAAYVSSGPLADNQWTVGNITLANGAAEVFNRGIIDPGEQATVSVKLNPGVWASSKNSVVLTTDMGATLEIDFAGEDKCGYYLHNNPTPPTGATNQQANLTADSTLPSQSTLYNYDQDRDASAGRVLVKGASVATEADLTKYQNWRTAVLGSDLSLNGSIRVRLYGAIKNFDSTKTGSVRLFLRDYDPASGYTEIESSTLTVSPWDAAATGSFVEKWVTFSDISYTVPAGHQLEVKLIVLSIADDDMWFAYDTQTYPAFVELPTVLNMYFHSESRYVADNRYNVLRTNSHEAGYYLHGNPTPPTANTNGQANLTQTQVYPSATTLYDYDRDIDPNDRAGRWIRKGGSGPLESDLEDYQNWRTSPMEADTRVQGRVRLDFWSAVNGFSTSATGSVTAYLREYIPASSTTTEITSKTLTATPWDAEAGGTWVRRFVDFDVIDHVIDRGNQLEVKIIVGNASGGDMDFAYDTTSYPSVLILPGALEPDPEGKPITETVDPGAATGRIRLPTNSGKFVFPLKGYTTIGDATWTATYRVRRDSYGFVWFTSGVSIAPDQANQWRDINLSSVVPVGATGVVVELYNSGLLLDRQAMLRGKADTTDYIVSYTELLQTGTHRWQVVKVDSNRLIQGYASSLTDVQFRVLGYTIGDDPAFFDVPSVLTTTAGQWNTVNVSSLVDSDATGAILLVESSAALATAFGVRETGSSFSATNREVSPFGNTVYFVGLDANKTFQAYPALATTKFLLVGQTKRSVTFNVNDTPVTDPTLGSWQPVDADSYSVPATATGVILYAHNADAGKRDVGFRHGDSNDNWSKQLWASGHFQAAVGLNAANEWDEYLQDADTDVSIAAYTFLANPVDADVHADLDVLVRKANGEVRATLATDAANSAVISGPSWQTLTASTTIATYTVVEQTDYLEIDLFAHVTRNDAQLAAISYFRLDDATFVDSSRPKVTGVVLHQDSPRPAWLTYYPHNNPSPPVGHTASQVNLPMTRSASWASTLYNYDTNRDAVTGLLIKKGGSGASESDTTKYQNWRSADLTSELAIQGEVEVRIFAAIKDFADAKQGQVTAYLRDWNGTAYTEIGNGTLTLANWQAGSSDYVEAIIIIPSVSYTLPACPPSPCHQLELKILVGGAAADDMWLAYDVSSYNARIVVPLAD